MASKRPAGDTEGQWIPRKRRVQELLDLEEVDSAYDSGYQSFPDLLQGERERAASAEFLPTYPPLDDETIAPCEIPQIGTTDFEDFEDLGIVLDHQPPTDAANIPNEFQQINHDAPLMTTSSYDQYQTGALDHDVAIAADEQQCWSATDIPLYDHTEYAQLYLNNPQSHNQHGKNDSSGFTYEQAETHRPAVNKVKSRKLQDAEAKFNNEFPINPNDRHAHWMLTPPYSTSESQSFPIWSGRLSTVDAAKRFLAGVGRPRRHMNVQEDDWQDVQGEASYWAKELATAIITCPEPRNSTGRDKNEKMWVNNWNTRNSRDYKRLMKVLDGAEGSDTLQARTTVFVDDTIKFHEFGNDPLPTTRNTQHPKANRNLKCSERLNRIMAIVEMDKRTACDMFSNWPPYDLIANPDEYLSKKENYCKGNATRARKTLQVRAEYEEHLRSASLSETPQLPQQQTRDVSTQSSTSQASAATRTTRQLRSNVTADARQGPTTRSTRAKRSATEASFQEYEDENESDDYQNRRRTRTRRW